MFDAHRHLPRSSENLSSTTHTIWFATSDPSEWDAVNKARRYDAWRYGFGVLPSRTPGNRSLESLVEEIYQLLSQDENTYIGEFGLDERYVDKMSLDRQVAFARMLLQLANRMRRIAVLHHVGSFTVLERLLTSVDISCPVLVHGYLGSIESARRLGELGATVSIGERLYSSPTKLGKRIMDLHIPFVLETDFPHVVDATDYEGTLGRHYERVASMMGIETGELVRRMDEFATILAHRPIARP